MPRKIKLKFEIEIEHDDKVLEQFPMHRPVDLSEVLKGKKIWVKRQFNHSRNIYGVGAAPIMREMGDVEIDLQEG